MKICIICSDVLVGDDPGVELLTICERCERAHFPMNTGSLTPANEKESSCSATS